MPENKYEHKVIEIKWQEFWDKQQTFKAADNPVGKKAYVLDMFPYPSAQGLHVGHAEGYTATDIYCRYLRMKSIEALRPMGWDAFGLPAENYAIKTGRHPKEVTWESIDNYRRQLKSLGLSYDWSREINTADPGYYQWTQWLFLKLYEKGLAYQKQAPVNWCNSCQTVLANEQVITGECERCHNQVEQRQMKQWFFKITEYAEELLKDLDKLNWPANIIEMQKNWIGKSEGALVKFPLVNMSLRAQAPACRQAGSNLATMTKDRHVPIKIGTRDDMDDGFEIVIPAEAGIQKQNRSPIKSGMTVRIFTTRLDTIFGATYLVLAPEHELVQQLKEWITNWLEVEKYIKKAQSKTELERKAETKEKIGVKLEGLMAINPANKEEIPIFIADYVLTSYGTGAIMAVPAHDERDWEFAQTFGQRIINVIKPLVDPSHFDDYFFGAVSLAAIEGESVEGHNRRILIDRLEAISKGQAGWSGPGLLVNSGEFNGLTSEAAQVTISKKIGVKPTIQYRLRDWLISRQRYWGAPIPIIHCSKCGAMPVPEKDLPVKLPDDVDFRPTGESPLKRSKSFHQVKCPKCGQEARRESDTMDTFVDSSWYFLRYCDPQNNQQAFDTKKVKTWCPVDFYVGGAEHAVMHLLYARFFTKVLADLGYVKFREPFLKLRNQGLILGEDGQKMSKSRGNVINPDEIVAKYGADTFRLYEMFMGPLEDAKPWNTASIIGMRRFLERLWLVIGETITKVNKGEFKKAKGQATAIHTTIKKVSEDIEAFKFNTAISALMEYFNKKDFIKENQVDIEAVKKFLILLYPFVPHLAAEFWQSLETKKMIWQQTWPDYNKDKLQQATIEIVIQVNGKLRGSLICKQQITESEVIAQAQTLTGAAKYLQGKKIIRTVYLPGKLINFVIK